MLTADFYLRSFEGKKKDTRTQNAKQSYGFRRSFINHHHHHIIAVTCPDQ